MKKLSITLLTLSLTFTLIGQNATTDKENVKKDGQYENQYKESSNFYINSDGLVVYKRSGVTSQNENRSNTVSDNHQTTETADYSNTTNETVQTKGTPVIVKKEAYDNNSSRTENKEEEPVLIKATKKAPINEYTTEEQTYTPPVSVSSSTATGIKKEAMTVDESISINSKPENLNNLDEESVNYGAINPSKRDKKNADKSISSEEAKKKYKKYNTYEKRPSQYKNIEEAALAVDAMIEELKKNQTQTTRARSMSSRLSTGANRASLKKKPLSSSSFSGTYNTSSQASGKPASTQTPEQDSAWGNEPTYYINGTEAEQSDIDLLRKKDIIRKEFKIRNTVSGNPNGEVWYEVKDYNRQK